MIRKIRLFSKFMTSQPGKQTVAIHLLHNISRSNGNQIMKFGQLIEYNMRNVFLEKSYTKCAVFWWCRGVVGIATAQLHSTKPELRFCAGSNPARGMSEIRDGEDL